MVRVTEELVLSPEHVTLYYASDPLLGQLPVLIFHGPSTTANFTHNTSRVQIHIYSAAGFQSYHRITISPNSPFYSVVAHLPREFQGDEICRALAFGLFRYFSELPDGVKHHLRNQYPTTRNRRPGSAPTLFGEEHAADLAKSAVQASNTPEIIHMLESALRTQHISNVDLDLVLPPGSIIPLQDIDLEEVPDDEDDILDPTLRQYGGYTPLVKVFGEPVFLPTSRLRRAPSRPTSLNRSKSFSHNQKVELRMKMGELVDTEERYVMKLNELVNNVADNFRQSAKQRSAESTSPTEDDLEKLFPKSADSILQINRAFMTELRRIMDDTEEDALRDLDLQQFGTPRTGGSTRVKDPSGALAMARLFLDWFPKFTDCYQDYIRASQHFPQLLNSYLDTQSSFRQRVVQTGEQTIRSLLIEPVQRLPRYSLFIDQIVASLPFTHPALQLMLRARDIITNICSMDDPLPDKPHVTNRLRAMVECWPVDLEPQGRLVLAADFIELATPYVDLMDVHVSQDRAGLFLLFSDCIVILKKKTNPGLTGRDFLREIDKPSPAGLLASMTNVAGGPGNWEFAFTGWHSLADVRFTESQDGRLVWMTSTQEMKGAHSGEYFTSKAITSRCFLLQETYDGRANKWSEDIIKARIEGRFPEKEREDPTWTLRAVKMEDNNFGLHAAVFQEAAEQLVEGRREPAPIRIVVDNHKGTKGAPVGHYGVEIVIEISSAASAESGNMKRISMNTLGLNGKKFTDDIAVEDFLPTLSRRIVQLLGTQFSVANLKLVPALTSYYTKILRALNMSSRLPEKGSRTFLSSSPVKMLSNFLAGNMSSASTAAAAAAAQHSSQSSLHRKNSSQKDLAMVPSSGSLRDRDGTTFRMTVEDETRPENPLVRLEQTFTGYVASLQARKGYFIGRTLFNRSFADELLVNDLYNRLIEFPFDLEASAEIGTEVIFAAFEKFVRIAWREQIGPIITLQMLDALQARASRRVPGDFADFVRFLFSDMAPQNRRAFTALVKLLADLLDGCGNDGDRGALTLAFAELLVDGQAKKEGDGEGGEGQGKPENYVNLLDLLVEDVDKIFGERLALKGTAAYEGVNLNSLNASARSYKSNTGSVTSNTSSLRRKLGFDNLLRQNSNKSEEGREKEKKEDRPSMWRTLSKAGKSGTSHESSSLSKAYNVNRSRSIDMGVMVGHGPNKLRRPNSRDHPPIAGVFDQGPPTTRPSSSHRLETIGEPDQLAGGETGHPTKSVKKKRRSSLSDLKSLMAAASLHDDEEEEEERKPEPEPQPYPLMPLRINKMQPTEKFATISWGEKPLSSSLRQGPPSPSRIPITPTTNGTSGSPNSKDGRSSPLDPVSGGEKEKEKMGSSGTRRPHSKTLSSSQIPTLRPPTRSRSNTATGETSPTRSLPQPGSMPASPTRPGSSSPSKLRLQSPQKLRERLQFEKRAVDQVDASLRSELSRITEEMARTSTNSSSTTSVSSSDLRRIASSIRALEERLPAALEEITNRQDDLNRDVEAHLKSAENKVKGIDQLYKEAMAENELLYEKFNSELGKIVKALKNGKERKDSVSKDGKEEIVARLKEANEETARVKKENARLRREIVSLRALMRGGSVSSASGMGTIREGGLKDAGSAGEG
ncbi:Rho guanine nucleotide exchange factor gef2 [Rhypophila decipiens]|uniref:Rho guanine nucleotide exchange factor gef2 n=1 Tax=Rhypophila decipiens TaxID=261697 RepID=A0AAN6Y323_9PEZI|nr:Rho guanine nucleotide exchange factor gef2 [Rhypophila decipiens]